MTADPTITGRAHYVRTRRTEWVAAPGAGPARPGDDAGCPRGSTGEDRRSPPGSGTGSPPSAHAPVRRTGDSPAVGQSAAGPAPDQSRTVRPAWRTTL